MASSVCVLCQVGKMFAKHACVSLLLFGIIVSVSPSPGSPYYGKIQPTPYGGQIQPTPYGGKIQPANDPASSKRTPVADSTPTYIYAVKGPVHAEIISPNAYQKINIANKKVFLNNKRIVRDTCWLTSKKSYQKRADGSMWYTNLPVGTPMTEEEIQKFEKDAAGKRKKISEEVEANDTTKGYQYITKGPITVEVISPKWQKVDIKGSQVFVNGLLENSDASEISATPTYQKRSDDSLWYTNVMVGIPQTAGEIEQFEKDANAKRMMVFQKSETNESAEDE